MAIALTVKSLRFKSLSMDDGITSGKDAGVGYVSSRQVTISIDLTLSFPLPPTNLKVRNCD